MKLLIICLFALLIGCAEQERYLEITSPLDRAVIDVGQPLTVQGTGKGLFENNVVLSLEDADGKQLQQIPTTLKTNEIGGAGSWEQSITLNLATEKAKLIAISPSPVEGEAPIISRPVFLTVSGHLMSHLENITWQLSYFIDQEGKETAITPGSHINAIFSNQKLNGFAGCNGYFGSYQITRNQELSLNGPIGTTMKSCSSVIDAQEQKYLKLLTKAVKFRIEKDDLILLDQIQNPIVKFSAVKSTGLENTSWRATGINNGRGGVVSDNNTHLTSVRFENGKIQGKAACNQYSASYTLQEQQISIGPVQTTRKFCSEEGVMEQEAQFLDALSLVSRYELMADRLNFRDQNGSLLASFEKLK